MKKIILFLLLVSSYAVNAQSLKDLLYSGKLKKHSSGVIRKTDDLSTKIDTVQKKEAPPANVTVQTPAVDSAVAKPNPVANTTPVAGADVDTTAVVATEPAQTAAAGTAPPKSNTKILKEYSDELIAGLKDVLANKKVKKETYFFTFEYEIDEQGAVSINNVTVSPDNSFLLEQVRERILTTPPQLAPALDSSNKPRKVKRRHSFSVTKD